MIGGSFGFHAL